MSETDTLITPYCLFRMTVAGIGKFGTNFRRFTFTGPDLDLCADNGYDQRIKLIFPLPGVGLDPMPTGPEWYMRWRELPDELRNPIRTYTIRATRPERNEVDIDVALHGRIGVASAWATDAEVGDEILMFAPDRRYTGLHGGIDFLPPASTARYLLAGDETALPAIASILERLPADARGVAVVEVADSSDAAALDGVAPAGFEIVCGGRDGREHGAHLLPEVAHAAGRLIDEHTAHPVADLEDVDIEEGLLWESPSDDLGGPARASTDLYAWLAGEAGVIKALRRHLVSERGIDRKSVAFMGYWRIGRQEDNR
ncbi:siderophore-interacting protein [Nakamurella sp. YIM 132087]|uniref:Siderophore-interacting protein n=1 Tax=Nakamurella alba TaxID=2665158 RepID=A0A7K1FKP2_9ACTN|nr:siderophore-interacting protein [Nakamurella alba]MTD14717.1 siderophore-interacting protein [Nakamurella alba]